MKNKGTKMVNLRCLVLCRNKNIPANAPTEPPTKAQVSKTHSGIRQKFLFALNLSMPKSKKQKMLTTNA